MKLNHNTHSVQRSNVKTEAEFTIKTSAHAFEILSSGLYTDSVSAIVRELSCNAYDSHVMANKKDVPFEIHVPTRMEPFFSIRDFGTGLSQEDVLEIYTSYFHSTKSNSDDFIGALGLGSKSPFSFSNDFQVTSYFNGTEYKYAIFLNDTGVPSVALMGEVITDQPNGLEVRIPAEDRNRFLTAISKYLAYFEVKPTITGVPQADIKNIYDNTREPSGSDLDLDGKWFIASRVDKYHANRTGIVYGQVPYPANTDAIIRGIQKLCTEQQIEFYKSFSDMIVFIFDVGALNITANREELKYDDATLASIANRITEFHTKFFTKTKSLIEGYEHNNSLYKINRFLMTEVFKEESKFYNSLVFSQIDCDEFKKMKNYRSQWGKKFSHTVSDVVGVQSLHSVGYLDSYFSDAGGEHRARIRRGVYVNCLGIDKPIVYYVVDDPKHAAAKVRQDFIANRVKGTEYVMISPNDIKGTDPKALADDLAAIKEGLGNPDFIFTSTLTYTAPVRQKKGLGKKAQIGTVFGGAPHWNSKTDLDFEAGGVYVYLAGGKKLYKGSKAIYANSVFENYAETTAAYQSMVNIYNKARDTSIKTGDIVGVSAADIKNFDGDDNWTNLLDIVEKYVKKNQKQMNLELQEFETIRVSLQDVGIDCESESFYQYFEHMAESRMNHIDRKAIIDQIDNNSDFHKTLVKLHDIKKKRNEDDIAIKGYNVVLGLFADQEYKTVSQYDNRFQVKLDTQLIALEKKYRMIGMLDRWKMPHSDLKALQSIVEYIKMIDNK